jgi:hypothetical protein
MIVEVDWSREERRREDKRGERKEKGGEERKEKIFKKGLRSMSIII